MKRISIVLFSVFFFQSVFSQEIEMQLWEGDPPNYKSSGIEEKHDTTNILRISGVTIPEMAIFLPSKEIATGQAVVICPGGGYRILAYTKEGTDIAKWLNSIGIAAIVLKYRLPSRESNTVPHETPLLDAKRAIRLVRYNSQKWNIDPDKIGIMGFSAGGHLASTLSTHFDYGNKNADDPIDQISSRPDFAILIYPVISFQADITHSGSRTTLLGEDPDPDLVVFYSNELQVKEDTPPTFLIHAQDDGGVPVQNSLAYYQALLDNGIQSEMHIYPAGGHGFGFGYGKGSVETWSKTCGNWLYHLDLKED